MKKIWEEQRVGPFYREFIKDDTSYDSGTKIERLGFYCGQYKFRVLGGSRNVLWHTGKCLGSVFVVLSLSLSLLLIPYCASEQKNQQNQQIEQTSPGHLDDFLKKTTPRD